MEAMGVEATTRRVGSRVPARASAPVGASPGRVRVPQPALPSLLGNRTFTAHVTAGVDRKLPAPVVQRMCASCMQEKERAAIVRRQCASCRDETTPVLQRLAAGGVKVGRSDDPLEADADRIARRVVGGGPGGVTETATSSSGSHGRGVVGPVTPRRLTTGGIPIPRTARAFFERRMGRDFGSVRVHADAEARRVTAAAGASAFAYGNHVWLSSTRQLGRTFTLAHELAHVAQQGGAPPLGQGVGKSTVAAVRGEAPVVRRIPVTRREIAMSVSSPGGLAALPYGVSLYNFAIGGDALKAEHRPLLQELGRLHTRFRIRFHFAGHTDSTDTEQVNLALSHARVTSVVHGLAGTSVGSGSSSFHGEQVPIARNSTPTGRSRNRRVDVVFLPPPGIVPPTRRPTPPPGPPPTRRPPPRHDPAVDSFCQQHPIVCTLFGAGATAMALCLQNPGLCALAPAAAGIVVTAPGIAAAAAASAGPLALLALLGLGAVLLPALPGGGSGDPPSSDPDEDDEPQCGDPRLPFTVVRYGVGPKALWVEADPLTRCPPTDPTIRGSVADRSRSTWPTGWDCIPSSATRHYRRAHLLHGPGNRAAALSGRHLHGPGNRIWNITPAAGPINDQMRSRVEQDGFNAVRRVHDQDQVLFYRVQVEHFTGPYPRSYFAERVRMRVGTKNPLTGARTYTHPEQVISTTRQPPNPSDCPGAAPLVPVPSPTTPAPATGGATSSLEPVGPQLTEGRGSGRLLPRDLRGLTAGQRISMAAWDAFVTLEPRARVERLEYDALREHCRIGPTGPVALQAWLTALADIARRRVDVLYRVGSHPHRLAEARLIGPCPPAPGSGRL